MKSQSVVRVLPPPLGFDEYRLQVETLFSIESLGFDTQLSLSGSILPCGIRASDASLARSCRKEEEEENENEEEEEEEEEPRGELGGSVIYIGGFVDPGSISLWAQASRSDLDRSKIDGCRSRIRI
jgi:hypothetical protein